MISRYDYQTINIPHDTSVSEAANWWAARGWRVVGVFPSEDPGYINSLLLEQETPPSMIMIKGPSISFPKKKRAWWQPKRRSWTSL